MTQINTYKVPSKRHGTRLFRHVAAEPYQRRDGTLTILSVWQTPCVQCGTPFHIKTPANARTSKAFGVVHCRLHRKAATRTGGPFSHTGILDQIPAARG